MTPPPPSRLVNKLFELARLDTPCEAGGLGSGLIGRVYGWGLKFAPRTGAGSVFAFEGKDEGGACTRAG